MAKGKRGKRKEIKIRTRSVGPFPKTIPATAQAILNTLLGGGVKRSHLSFSVNMMPPSVNKMYVHTRFATRLTEEAKDFRMVAGLAIGHQKHTFSCGGTAVVMIFLENPHWITLKLMVNEMDVDNRIKPILDAIKEATGIPDETNWEIHAWKIVSKQIRTTVHLFDAGDVVDYYA